MKLFGNNPQEKAMQSLIHDSNEAIFQMRKQIEGIESWIENNKSDIKGSEIYLRMEYLKSSCENLQKSIDIYYNRFSKDFVEDEVLLPRTPSLNTEEALKKEIQWLRNRYDTLKPRMSRLANHYKQKYLELEKSLNITL